MRTIKFCGRNEYGEVFYFSFDEDTCTIDCRDIAETVVVERDTVAQLVGYDAKGNEVYEGNKVVYANRITTAELLRVPAGDNYLLEDTK